MQPNRVLPVAAAIAVTALPGTAHAAVPHTVVSGETLWSIAAAQNLTTRTVAAFNGLSESSQVFEGQTIQIPTVEEGATALASAEPSAVTTDPPAATPAPAAGTHIVVAGETLSAIAVANGLDTTALAAANGRSGDSFVYEGEALQIPAAGDSTVAALPASSSTAGLGHIPSPYGELHLEPSAAESWNTMRDESLRLYGQDLHPAGPVSAHRTYEQQAQLYNDYLNGVGPPAAPPGTSNHESGTAVDLETQDMRWVIDQIGLSFGWGKTEAPSEWWHVNYAP